MKAVAWVLALVTCGITEESATQIPVTPLTRHCWFPTATGAVGVSGAIGQQDEECSQTAMATNGGGR